MTAVRRGPVLAIIRKPRPILNALATDYAEMMRLGENTVATRLTLFRQRSSG